MKCKNYGEDLLRRFAMFDGKVGTFCDECSEVSCEHHAVRHMDKVKVYAVLLFSKGLKEQDACRGSSTD